MALMPSDIAKLESVTLRYGPHGSRESGMCAMEAVAWLAGEEHSDRPQCASPVLTGITQMINDFYLDSLEDGVSTRNSLLKPLIPRLVGSRKSPQEEAKLAKKLFDILPMHRRLRLDRFLIGVPSGANALEDARFQVAIGINYALEAGVTASIIFLNSQLPVEKYEHEDLVEELLEAKICTVVPKSDEDVIVEELLAAHAGA